MKAKPHLVFMLFILFITSCGGIQNVDISSVEAIYLQPSGDNLVSKSVLEEANVIAVDNFSQMQSLFSQNPDILILYLHPDTLNAVDDQWLKEQYNDGVTIVALNTPLSQLSAKLNLVPTMEDVELGEFAEDKLLISLHQNLSEGQSTTGSRALSDYFNDFSAASDMIRTLVNS